MIDDANQASGAVASQPPTLDDLDKAILVELTADPFASNVAVAKALGAAPALVTRRIRLLERSRISQTLAVIDLDRIGQSFCFVRITVRGRSVAEVAHELAKHRLVIQVSELTSGESDLLLLVRFSNVNDLNNVLSYEIANVQGVRRWNIDVVIEVPIFRPTYVSYEPNYKPLSISENLECLRVDLPPDVCDDIDLQIIATLQNNAHQSINDVARKLNMKPSTVRYRINNLKASDILRFTTVVDPRSLGLKTIALFEMNVDIGKIENIIESLRDKEWISQLFRCVGSADLMTVILAPNSEEVLRVRRSELSEIDGVDEIRVSYLHSTHKLDMRWAQRPT